MCNCMASSNWFCATLIMIVLLEYILYSITLYYQMVVLCDISKKIAIIVSNFDIDSIVDNY